MRISIYFILSAFVLLSFSCGKPRREKSDDEYRKVKDSMVDVNKFLVKKDAEKIKAYIERRGWKMTESQTGLWYMVYENGAGEKSKTGQVVTLAYTVDLLDGTQCYSSDSLGYKEFKIGEGGVESGLEEGILLLREGDKAKFIMPPHLAHGLIGDEVCIPARSVIIYDVHVIKLGEI